MGTRVAVVVLGDEVLKAEVKEANFVYLLPLLNEWGARVTLCAVLPDHVETVARHLALYRTEADLVVLTGGIGPTPDDITREAVARVANVPVVEHPVAKALLEDYYADKGGMNRYRMLMAMVPEGAELIPNPLSGAPGFFIDGMAAFPGVPRLLQGMAGWLRARIEGRPLSRVTLYTRAAESHFAGIMAHAMEAFPDVSVGSYPMMETGGYKVRLVFRSPDFERAAACADRFRGDLEGLGQKVERREEDRR